MTVIDEFNAAADPDLPTVRLALDPDFVRSEFKRGLPRLAGAAGTVELKGIRVIRHKPSRRCVLEYDIRILPEGGGRQKAKLIGKIRAKRYGNEGYRLLDALWQAGFDDAANDGICVPEPIGVIAPLRMWLQRRVSGVESTGIFLEQTAAEPLARRVAEATHKIHTADLPVERQHTIEDELKILHERLPVVWQMRSDFRSRIESLLNRCDLLGRQIPATKPCPIHRDFYPAQLIVGRRRIYLLDFDLFCHGDPALDIGNFVGHLTEISLRTFNNPKALRASEQTLISRFLELSGEHRRFAVEAYSLLTLVRHVYLSTQFPERTKFTEGFLSLCEERLAQFGLP